MNKRQRIKQGVVMLRRAAKSRKRSRDRHYQWHTRYRVTFCADKLPDRAIIMLSGHVLTHHGVQYVITRPCTVWGIVHHERAQVATLLRHPLQQVAKQIRATFGPIPGIDAALEVVPL